MVGLLVAREERRGAREERLGEEETLDSSLHETREARRLEDDLAATDTAIETRYSLSHTYSGRITDTHARRSRIQSTQHFYSMNRQGLEVVEEAPHELE